MNRRDFIGTAALGLAGTAGYFAFPRAASAAMIVGPSVEIPRLAVPATTNLLQSSGRLRANDGFGAFWRRVPLKPVHAGRLRSADGSWWEYVPEEGGAFGPRWNIGQFTSAADAPADQSALIQQLCDAIAATSGGGELFHPGGTIRAAGIRFGPGIAFTGVPGRSIYRRIPGGSRAILRSAGPESAFGIVVSGLTFDLDTEAGRGSKRREGDDFATGVQIDGADDGTDRDHDVRIQNCRFLNSGAADAGDWTLTGVVLQGVRGATVSDIESDGCQLKLAGGGQSTRRLQVRNVTSRNARAYGISVVVDEGGSLRDISIRDVEIDNPARGGLFLGTDGGNDVETTSVEGLDVANVVIAMGDLPLKNGKDANFALKYAGAGSEGAIGLRNVRIVSRGVAKALRRGFAIGLRGPSASLSMADCRFEGSSSGYATEITGLGMPGQRAAISGGEMSGDQRGVIARNIASLSVEGLVLDGKSKGEARLDLVAEKGSMQADIAGLRSRDARLQPGDALVRFDASGGAISGTLQRHVVSFSGNATATTAVLEKSGRGGKIAITYRECDWSALPDGKVRKAS